MQKVSNLTFAVFVLCFCCVTAQAEGTDAKNIPLVQLDTCFAQTERLARLECYDVLLGRPQLLEDAQASDDVPIERVAEMPRAVAYAHDLLVGQDLVGGKVHMTLRRPDGAENQELNAYEGGGLAEFLKEPRTEEMAKKLRLENDLFLAMESDPAIGEAAIMILSCENNISRLKVVFNHPYEGRFADARFYGSETLSDESALRRKLWVRGDGYLVENARGLDSIRLIARLVAGSLSQVAVGNGEAIRSAFFDTAALKQALPHLARHCSWSSGVTK